MKKYKPVEVEWIDAQSSMGALTISELEKQPLIRTMSCGYLIKEDKEKIVLGFMMFGKNMDDEDLIKHYQVIPKKMVIKIRELFEPHGVLIKKDGTKIPLKYKMVVKEDGHILYKIMNQKDFLKKK